MAKKEKMLEDLFYETLKDIYYAEKQIVRALPEWHIPPGTVESSGR